MQGEQEQAYQRLVAQDPRYVEAEAMILSAHDKLKGEAIRKELRELILTFGSPQCGSADESVKARIGQIEDLPRLRNLAKAAVTARSWDELLEGE